MLYFHCFLIRFSAFYCRSYGSLLSFSSLSCRLDKVSLTSVKSTGAMSGTFALRLTLDVETP